MKLNWNFLGGGEGEGVQNLLGGIWMFSGIIGFNYTFSRGVHYRVITKF